MRIAFTTVVLGLALMGSAPAALAAEDWTPQIPSLRLPAPLTPDPGLNIGGGSAAGYVPGAASGGGGGFQFGDNIAAANGALFARFQKGAFPFRAR